MADHGGNIYEAAVTLDFSANISPLGIPKGVQAAIQGAVSSLVHYPDPRQRELREALGAYYGVQAEQIICGNGGADVIYRLAAARKPVRALIPVPTFSEYGSALEQQGCQVTYWQMEGDFSCTDRILEQLTCERYDMLVLCNPNNPTGLCLSETLLEQILRLTEKTQTFVLLDECFLELTDGETYCSRISQLEQYPHLFVLKSMTKLYAIPGLRLGFGLCSDTALLADMEAIGQPWPVNSLASAAGCAALQEAVYRQQVQDLIQEQRPFLQQGLRQLGFRVWDSKGNFLFFQAPNCTDLREKLLPFGILIRSCGNYLGLDKTYYRVAVRTKAENQMLLHTLTMIQKGETALCQQNPL